MTHLRRGQRIAAFEKMFDLCGVTKDAGVCILRNSTTSSRNGLPPHRYIYVLRKSFNSREVQMKAGNSIV